MRSQTATSNQQLNLPLYLFYVPLVAKTLFNPFFHRQPSPTQTRHPLP